MYSLKRQIQTDKQKKQRTTRMKNMFFRLRPSFRQWICFMTIILSFTPTMKVWGQVGGEATVEELVDMGFENVRWTENDDERIYTVENNVYKANGVGISNEGRHLYFFFYRETFLL